MTAPLREAAEIMRQADAGTVLVSDDESRLVGIVTDRDIAIRAVAEGRDPTSVTVGDISTPYPTAVPVNTSIREAFRVMREHAIRRLPVVERDRLVGVVSLGDLAIRRDTAALVADISAAPSTDQSSPRQPLGNQTREMLLKPDVMPDLVVLPDERSPVSARGRSRR
jgi:signal-transduction protein with cAMP-binding, CBS, and nucleotidyltransferase domain